jgi:N-acetylneuraminate synthase
MRDLADSFDTIPGLSDHSHGVAVSVAATALGACFIEKHFTLCRDDGGPDAAFSLEPPELRELVDSCRSAWQALGKIYYDPKGCERGSELLRRSIYVVEDVEVGAELTIGNIRSIRPGLGLAPKFLPQVLGRRAGRALKRGDPLSWEMIESDG